MLCKCVLCDELTMPVPGPAGVEGKAVSHKQHIACPLCTLRLVNKIPPGLNALGAADLVNQDEEIVRLEHSDNLR